MKRILITGACGQIGTELVALLRKEYGVENVVASGRNLCKDPSVCEGGLFERVDVTDAKGMAALVDKYRVDTIINLAALLSAVGESKPQMLWDVNMNGLYNCLEIAREKGGIQVFTPSSIAAFGPTTPRDKTPQVTIQRPTTIYGVSKVAGELLSDYYFHKFGVDTRGVRFPGLISYAALPGGGTTDYAVHIYYDALQQGKFSCNLKADTYMDMMYMPDALNAIVQLAEADPKRLINRNAFNITAMSFCPEDIAAEIKKHIPNFEITYEVDPIKQAIADSWPNSLDDSAAREEWDWNPVYKLDNMTAHMLKELRVKLGVI
ncbi:MAG: L-threonine 3-dehydrogenase [Bacillota bacterium]|nr:L-threonine 3-dehydrogenase [Bacillota bacterium]